MGGDFICQSIVTKEITTIQKLQKTYNKTILKKMTEKSK